jgi:hypothetical protein
MLFKRKKGGGRDRGRKEGRERNDTWRQTNLHKDI